MWDFSFQQDKGKTIQYGCIFDLEFEKTADKYILVYILHDDCSTTKQILQTLSFCCSVSLTIKTLRLKGKFGVGISDARTKRNTGCSDLFQQPEAVRICFKMMESKTG